MQKVGAPKRLEIRMAGESLFNDGVGVVIFLTILEVAVGDAPLSVSGVLWLLVKEAGGGAALGFALGYIAYRMLKRVDEYQVEILITLALAMGGYALADALHVSAPIAAVVAGLFIGNHGRAFAMSAKTREHVDTFWELLDGILNAILFLLLGLEVLVVPFDKRFVVAGLLAIPITVAARWLSVAGIVAPLRHRLHCEAGTIRVLTWGALRGGISVALALSLPKSPQRDLLLTVTYVVVIFSIVIQGLTVGSVIRHVTDSREPVESGHP
jgi:CPA1 family monovalent cation:H+ antiporter